MASCYVVVVLMLTTKKQQNGKKSATIELGGAAGRQQHRGAGRGRWFGSMADPEENAPVKKDETTVPPPLLAAE